MKRYPLFAFFVLLFLFATTASLTHAQHWPQFRGPGAAGVAETGGAPVKWDAAKAAKLSSQKIISEAKPTVTDLRSFIEKARQEFPEDVLTISKEVDPRFEITAVVVKLEQERRFPIVIFENVKGAKFPVVTNVHASRRRLAAAIGSEPRRAVASYLKRIERLIPPKEVETGPVKDALSGSWLGHPLHPLATDVASGTAVDLHDRIVDEPTLRTALRASAALPLLAGPPVQLDGRRLLDAGLSAAIPFRAALAGKVIRAPPAFTYPSKTICCASLARIGCRPSWANWAWSRASRLNIA